MPRVLALVLPLALVPVPVPAMAPALTAEEMQGSYESTDGGGNTCAGNPARLDVSRGPDHVTFDWPVGITVFDGSTRTRVRYDLLEERPDALVLRLEGETRRTDAGDRVIWLLRPTPSRDGFCWGRTDWPMVRCEHAYRRCAEVPPTS